uniref:Transcriptional regulator n=1 Tax=Strongyloides venezuelensis TaxID=75913 RepID=A0A0K0G656_STRVS
MDNHLSKSNHEKINFNRILFDLIRVEISVKSVY